MTKILALLDDRAGNNAQVLGIAERLGLPFETRRLHYNFWMKLPYLLVPGLSAAKMEPLAAAPDVIISAGRRESRVAVQLKQRAGGTPMLVHMMRPESHMNNFSLLVIPAHDGGGYPQKPDIIRPLLSAHGITTEKLNAARAEWNSLAQLPSPRVAVLVGGTSKHATYSNANWGELKNKLQAFREKVGGSLMITTSRRTGAGGAQALSELRREGQDMFYDWEAQRGEKNPFMGFLAHADAVVVTGDSISMCSEAVATGRPVYVFTIDKTMNPKFVRFLNSLYENNYARPFSGEVDLTWKPSVAPDTAAMIAARIKDYLQSRE